MSYDTEKDKTKYSACLITYTEWHTKMIIILICLKICLLNKRCILLHVSCHNIQALIQSINIMLIMYGTYVL